MGYKPMDYDDNDFQSQNIHLAGEGSNKFPPVLQPYALPKFEFDDSLHGPLRFDSLVETEVFLGIESSEDNRWIEDFSGGSTGIQFSSSPAESCPISRRNNVWSEATSRESVEMLLKSVGQEEVALVPTNTRESDACDELGCMIKHMEPNSKEDNKAPSEVGETTNLLRTLLPCDIPENFPGAGNDTRGQQPSFEDNSYTQEDAPSIVGGLSDLTAITVGAQLCGVEDTSFGDGICSSSNKMEADRIVLNGSVDNMTHKEKDSTSGTQVDSVMHPIVIGSDDLNNDDTSNNVYEKANESNVLETSIGVVCEEQGVLTQEIQMDDKSLAINATEIGSSHFKNPLSSASVESTATANMIEKKLNYSAEPSSVTEKGDSGSYEALDDDQPQLGMHEVSMVNVEGNFTFETHKVEESYSPQLDEAKTTSEPGAHVLSVAHDKVSNEEYDGTGSKDEGGILKLTVECSSAEAVFETHAECQDSSFIAVDSMQLDNKSMELGQQYIPKCDEDVPFEVTKNTEFPSDGNKMESQSVASLVISKDPGSDTFGECGTESGPLVSKLSSDSAAENGLVDDEPAPSEDCITTVSVLNQKDSGMPSLPSEVDIQRISTETNLSDLKTSSRETSRLDPVSDLEKGTSSIAQEELCKSGDQLLPTVNPCNSENQTEPQEAVTNIRQESTELMEVCRVVSDNTNKGVGSGALTRESYGLVSPQASEPTVSNDKILAKDESWQDGSLKIHKETTSKSSDASEAQVAITITKECGSCADLEKSASVSDSAGGCSELSHKESKKDGAKESTEQAVSISEIFGGSTICGVSCDPKLNDSSKDERSFTFVVRPFAELPEKVDGEIWKPFPDLQANKAPLPGDASYSTPKSGQLKLKISQDVPPSTPNSGHLNPKISEDIPPSTPNSGQLNSKISQDIPPGVSKVSGAAVGSRGSKGNTERKPRRASCKTTTKDGGKKGGSRVACGKLERQEKGNNLSVGLPGFPHLVHSSEMPRYGIVDSGGLKPFALTPSTAGLPDLNSSASSVALFQQPFTDLQQVQLRAQIFVYGALIQGIAPDEAYMISAFGGLDGGKIIWENAWRSRIERINGQLSHLTTPETPLQSRSGGRTHDQGAKQSGVQSKAISSPVGRASNKGTPATAVNSLVLPSSPLWSLRTPSADTLQSAGMPRGSVMEYQHTLSPLHPHQTPPMRSFIGANPSWVSQPPFVAPWVASPQTPALDSSVRFSMQFSTTEPVQLTTVKELSAPHSSGAKHVSPGPLLPSGATTAGFFTASLVASVNKVTASGQPSNDPKPRKRKKTLVSDSPALVVLPQTQMETVPISTVTGYQPTAAPMSTPVSFVSNPPTEKFSTCASYFSTDLRTREQNAGQRAILSEETFSKVKEARVHAEDAAVVAAAAVTHGQEIWNELDKQKKSGLSPDVQTKLASAAVAIAAAAAVAKAAAAAANVATNAAMQAKLMADEALISGGYSNFSQSSAFEGTVYLGRTSPASSLKGDDGSNSSSSILVAAREAAKRQVEAASAAAKRAENMDAIVKAAELAAEAVSQAGKIVAMGDPFSLSELVAAGPEGYWKVAQRTPEVISKPNEVGGENVVIDWIAEGSVKSARSLKGSSSDMKETQITNLGKLTTIREISTEEDHVKFTNGLSGSLTASVRDAKRQKSRKTFDLDKTIVSVPESESGSRSSIHDQKENYQKVVENSKENGIREGSRVEVYKDGSGFKAAWFSAYVLTLKDGKAYVSYSDLTFREGLEKLKEWVALQGENGVPRIRNARPVTVMPSEGTRKRRRAAVGDYNWSVGDKVDAWIQDSWWEGVITEKSTEDETMLTVHFPVQGETSVVRAWHLRPSLMWKDGHWLEWSSSGQNHSASNGDNDTRQEKRPRLQSPALEVKGEDKEPKGVDVKKPDKDNEPPLPDLSADDNLFHIGKSTTDQSKSDALRMNRTGLQKERSRGIFGVPKPGKKRKFMEVSRHYVGDHSSKDNESTASVKFSKYPITEGLGSRGWKNVSKTEPTERLATLARPKTLKSGKPTSGFGRTIPQKDNPLSTSPSTSDAAVTNRIVKTKNSLSHAENTSGKNNLEFQPFSSEGAPGGAVVFSSKALPSGTSSKKMPPSIAKSERASKGKLAPAGGRLGKIEEEKVFNGSSARTATDVVEPRRSNRRIQPTSRLLEGLQSSLMVSKIPSISHDKVQKSRSASRGNSRG